MLRASRLHSPGLLRFLLLIQFILTSQVFATMTQLSSSDGEAPTIYTFQLQDSGYTEPGCGEPVRIEAAKKWARELDDATQIKSVNIVTYMEPHINFSDEKDRAEAVIGIEWTWVDSQEGRSDGEDGEKGGRYQMHATMDEYIGRWRNHLDRIFERIIENVNEKVKTEVDLTPAEQLEALFEGWRGSYMYLG